MGFILPGKESSSSQVLSNFLDDNNNLSATVHAIVQKGGKELYLVEVFSATRSLRELLEYHNYSKYGEIQIPPSPYYFQSWVSAPPLKRAVETSVNIKSVSEYHSHKVIFRSLKKGPFWGQKIMNEPFSDFLKCFITRLKSWSN